jgi:hypothetical protein
MDTEESSDAHPGTRTTPSERSHSTTKEEEEPLGEGYASADSTRGGARGATGSSVTRSGVEIVSFQRFDRFRQILLESEDSELRAARDALVEAGFDMNLASYGLGPGKLLVRVDLAGCVLDALRQLSLAHHRYLKASDVVVSRGLKPALLAVVRRHAPRANPVVRVETLRMGLYLGSGGCPERQVLLDHDEPPDVSLCFMRGGHLGGVGPLHDPPLPVVPLPPPASLDTVAWLAARSAGDERTPALNLANGRARKRWARSAGVWCRMRRGDHWPGR